MTLKLWFTSLERFKIGLWRCCEKYKSGNVFQITATLFAISNHTLKIQTTDTLKALHHCYGSRSKVHFTCRSVPESYIITTYTVSNQTTIRGNHAWWWHVNGIITAKVINKKYNNRNDLWLRQIDWTFISFLNGPSPASSYIFGLFKQSDNTFFTTNQ